jgi:hypothetical protein
VPVAIEWDYNGAAVYTGFCEYFEVLAEGEEPPFYEATICRDGNQVSVGFKREK